MERYYDILFIGSGPAGFAGAIRAAQLGASVAIVEAGSIGGVCLNRGCIPSKSMLHSAQNYVDAKKSVSSSTVINGDISYDFSKILQLRSNTIEKIRMSLERNIKANGIEIIKGFAELQNDRTLIVKQESIEEKIGYKHLVIATGSSPRPLPDRSFDGEFVLSSDSMLKLEELPQKTLIVGSGAIGIEWARILKSLDKEVVVMELADKLAPVMDESVSKVIERIFKKQRIEFYTSTSISSIVGKSVTLSNGKQFDIDKILVAIGRIPNINGFENSGLNRNNKGFIKVDENFKTNIENVYAVGDVTGIQMLAHTASCQAVQLVEYLFNGEKINIDYNNIPSVIYGTPEIAQVGATEQYLKSKGEEYKVSQLPLTISAKAYIDGELDGMVKILSQKNKIIGACVVADNASALLQQLVIAISMKLDVSELERVVFAHPTTSEAVLETLLNLDNKALYVPPKKV